MGTINQNFDYVNEFTFEQLMRAGHVKRWQIVRVAREQTIAEHMWRVWVITAQITKLMFAPDMTAMIAQQWALMHDTPEVITGDIATPTKAAMRKAVPQDDPIRNIELSLSDEYRAIWTEAKKHQDAGWPTPYEIVKLADVVEASCFLRVEGIGSHAQYVHGTIITAGLSIYDELKNNYPDLGWQRISPIINQL